MADGTHIEWTEATWNPVTGCSVVSPGCTNCYAMKLAGTRLGSHPSRAGLTRDTKAGPVWTGEVRFNEEWLLQPLQWRRPRMIFVCAHADLFQENVPDEWIDRIFAVMALAPQHTFQVLTKRPERMRAYCSDPRTPRRIYEIVCDMTLAMHLPLALILPGVDPAMAPSGPRVHLGAWPLPNVWKGVSVEDEKRANERILELLATPAAVRWISAEPLLGSVDLTSIDDGMRDGCHLHFDALTGLAHDGEDSITGVFGQPDPRIDWVVIGGESGPGARPMHPDWARSLRDQCAAAGVPFFFKQWGEYGPAYTADLRPTGVRWSGEAQSAVAKGTATVEQTTRRLGKKRAGRFLDGCTHDAMPEAHHA